MRSGASVEAAAMQIATVMTVVALLTTTAFTLADPAASLPKALGTPAMPKLLYVMEYDCVFDWEPVKLEQGVTNGVLAWMMQLQDRLTLTSQTPLGQELMVSLLSDCTNCCYCCKLVLVLHLHSSLLLASLNGSVHFLFALVHDSCPEAKCYCFFCPQLRSHLRQCLFIY